MVEIYRQVVLFAQQAVESTAESIRGGTGT